jgi:hypothetical protein
VPAKRKPTAHGRGRILSNFWGARNHGLSGDACLAARDEAFLDGGEHRLAVLDAQGSATSIRML